MPRNPLAFDPAHPDARPAATVGGGLYGNRLRQYIAQKARALGIDPFVPLAVAPHEGGFAGAVGDRGSSFGPFQLHHGGALPATVTNPQAWANSPAGVDYALGQIARTLGGRRGEQGVAATVREFERPAAQYVPGEIGKATVTYRELAGGAGQTAPPGTARPAAATPSRPGAAVSQGDWTTALNGGGRASSDWVGALSSRGSSPAPAPATSWVDALSGQPRARARVNPAAPAAAPSAPMPAGGYPLARPGKVIGVPYKGTHTLYGNWESDNAVDLATPQGTPVVALTSGTIGPQIGPLNASGDPRLEGLRLHLVTPGNEYYYAHLSRLLVHAGQKVEAGQILGYSGAANGVQHLHFAEKNGNPLQTVRA
jgi:murein DD-endopeptidase MepM/ murein hydrolase activator NlpD